jgi:hypothetical protein
MDEKILIKSQKYNVKKLFKTFLKIGLLLGIIATAFCFVLSYGHHHNNYDPKHIHNYNCYRYSCLHKFDSSFFYAINQYFTGYIICCIVPFAGVTLIGGLIYFLLGSCELTITNKRVFGKTVWGQRVDLPIDSVSAIGIGIFKSITVSTSSGRINFLAIKNRNEIHNVVSNLLVERQKQNATTMQTTVFASATSTADEIKKYKELLDLGIITQEEFDAKKKQLLGL